MNVKSGDKMGFFDKINNSMIVNAVKQLSNTYDSITEQPDHNRTPNKSTTTSPQFIPSHSMTRAAVRYPGTRQVPTG